jgi:preprotein translocase subunit SecA
VKGVAFHATIAEKWRAIVERVRTIHATGAPVLIGTASIQASIEISRVLDSAGLRHVVLNAEQSSREADIVARAGQRNAITVATNMAGRGTDIRLGPGVRQLGGLHVVMSEHHDSRRVDRQLSGRCGRQGDPGSFEAALSMQDPVIEEWNPRFARAATKLLPYLGAWLGRLTIWLAQRKAERLHARMRRDLLKADRIQDDNLAFSGTQ